jgi:hypothetical protein
VPRIVGRYVSSNVSYGYLPSDGNFTTIHPPGSTSTVAFGINDQPKWWKGIEPRSKSRLCPYQRSDRHNRTEPTKWAGIANAPHGITERIQAIACCALEHLRPFRLKTLRVHAPKNLRTVHTSPEHSICIAKGMPRADLGISSFSLDCRHRLGARLRSRTCRRIGRLFRAGSTVEHSRNHQYHRTIVHCKYTFQALLS